jgi:CubicO group peptidase (beta-lactamase class C family)
MSRHRIPGLSVALVDSRDLIRQSGFGWADDAHWVPVDPDTRFSIQSMSKTFTAVGVLTAVRDGLVDLDAPVTRYLPDFRVASIFEDRPQDRMTLRHLLTHTAGFTHEAPEGSNYDPGEPAFADHVASISSTWLMFRVGEQYHYSNLGIDLAGAILAKASGQELPASLCQRAFLPLGMSRTTADPRRILSEANRATGHQPGLTDLPLVVPMTGAGDASLLPARLIREMETTPNHGGYGLGIGMGRRGDDLFFTHGGGYGFLTSSR